MSDQNRIAPESSGTSLSLEPCPAPAQKSRRPGLPAPGDPELTLKGSRGLLLTALCRCRLASGTRLSHRQTVCRKQRFQTMLLQEWPGQPGVGAAPPTPASTDRARAHLGTVLPGPRPQPAVNNRARSERARGQASPGRILGAFGRGARRPQSRVLSGTIGGHTGCFLQTQQLGKRVAPANAPIPAPPQQTALPCKAAHPWDSCHHRGSALGTLAPVRVLSSVRSAAFGDVSQPRGPC